MDYYNNELYHHGVKGMKWGVRRYRNKDGSLTAAGKKRYSEEESKANDSNNKKKGLSDRQKTAVKIGAAAAGTLLAAYGAYKVGKLAKNKYAEMATKRALSRMTPEQMAYINRNIANTQNHVDIGKRITSSNSWKHAYESTIKSRQSSIAGDNKLYGNTKAYKEKFPNGRSAVNEARDYMYDSLRKEYDYWDKRVRNHG